MSLAPIWHRMRFGKLTFSVRCDLCSSGNCCANNRSRVLAHSRCPRLLKHNTESLTEERNEENPLLCGRTIINFWLTPRPRLTFPSASLGLWCQLTSVHAHAHINTRTQTKWVHIIKRKNLPEVHMFSSCSCIWKKRSTCKMGELVRRNTLMLTYWYLALNGHSQSCSSRWFNLREQEMIIVEIYRTPDLPTKVGHSVAQQRRYRKNPCVSASTSCSTCNEWQSREGCNKGKWALQTTSTLLLNSIKHPVIAD